MTGTYSFWVDENIFYYVPEHKFLGGYFMPYIALNYASGSLVAELSTWDQSGCMREADRVLPTRTSSHSIWAGILGNELTSTPDTVSPPQPAATRQERTTTWVPDIGATISPRAPRYTSPRTKGTTANFATDWEIHGQRTAASVPAGQTSKITPGQAFTDEWGLGQVLPLKKDMSLLGQLGVVGYDQWQVSSNGGIYLVAGLPVAASRVPYYSVHAIGVQANFILPAKNLVAFSNTTMSTGHWHVRKGRTIVFRFFMDIADSETRARKALRKCG